MNKYRIKNIKPKKINNDLSYVQFRDINRKSIESKGQNRVLNHDITNPSSNSNQINGLIAFNNSPNAKDSNIVHNNYNHISTNKHNFNSIVQNYKANAVQTQCSPQASNGINIQATNHNNSNSPSHSALNSNYNTKNAQSFMHAFQNNVISMQNLNQPNGNGNKLKMYAKHVTDSRESLNRSTSLEDSLEMHLNELNHLMKLSNKLNNNIHADNARCLNNDIRMYKEDHNLYKKAKILEQKIKNNSLSYISTKNITRCRS